jgi:hypothetical protein
VRCFGVRPKERISASITSGGISWPKQRTTLYRDPPPDRVAASFGAAPLSEPINTPAHKYERATQRVAALSGD